MPETKPLVLDVDGTFLKTDMLLESFWQAMGRDPIRCLRTCMTHLNNKARLKQELAAMVDLRTDLLPVNPDIASLAAREAQLGRKVHFASGSDISLVQKLADEHGVEDAVFASDGQTNLTGKRKADVLVQTFGKGGFDYAGDGIVDKPVWEAAENAIIVGHHPAIARQLAGKGGNVEEFRSRWRKRDLLRAMRPHQWVKNILLFLPLLAAHRFDLAGGLIVLAAAIAYSMAASSIYFVNDLLDLEADRLHPTKQNRPLASGRIPILVAMMASVLLGGFALGLAFVISLPMLGIVALYMGLSLAYSLKLKRMRWVDIATLAGLYTLRVIAGAVAAKVLASGFLIAFIYPMFITLGCVKRLTELALAKGNEKLPGRGYGRKDRSDLLNVAGLGTFGTLLVFFLYSFTEAAGLLYNNIWQLWLAIIPIAAWMIRMVSLGWKGKMDYDPIVFAMRDKKGLALIAVTLAAMFTAVG